MNSACLNQVKAAVLLLEAIMLKSLCDADSLHCPCVCVAEVLVVWLTGRCLQCIAKNNSNNEKN